jgi:hypothetical protein
VALVGIRSRRRARCCAVVRWRQPLAAAGARAGGGGVIVGGEKGGENWSHSGVGGWERDERDNSRGAQVDPVGIITPMGCTMDHDKA